MPLSPPDLKKSEGACAAESLVKVASFGAWIRIILTKESVRTSQVSGLGKKEIKTQFVSQMAKILHHSQLKTARKKRQPYYFLWYGCFYYAKTALPFS